MGAPNIKFRKVVDFMKNYESLVKDIEAKGYKLHHTAWTMGYVSRKSDVVSKSYNGRFGNGYTIERPSWDSTRYHLVDYFVKQ